MAMASRKEGYITCPYEQSHQILESRIQFHLVKCKKVNTDARLVECPFNATHLVPEPEMNCHVNYLCDDRRKLDSFICATEDDNKPLFEIQKIDIPSTEDWNDFEYKTYDPETHCNAVPVLLNLQGATPAARKAFRVSERQRVQQLKSGCIENEVEPEPAANKLRLPQTQAKASKLADKQLYVPPPLAKLKNSKVFGKSKSPPGTSKQKSSANSKPKLPPATAKPKSPPATDKSKSPPTTDKCKSPPVTKKLKSPPVTAAKKGNASETIKCNGAMPKEEEFVVPKYARGRGRGRLAK